MREQEKEKPSGWWINQDRRKYMNHCEPGAAFARWAEVLINQVMEGHPTQIKINTAYLQLLQNYFKRRNAANIHHKDRPPTNDNHICLYQVFVAAYEELQEIEVSINPPPGIGYTPYVADRSYRPRPEIHGLDLGDEEPLESDDE